MESILGYKERGGAGICLTFRIFTLDSAVIEAQKLLSSHETYAIQHHRETIKSNYHNKMKQNKWILTHRQSVLKKIYVSHSWPSLLMLRK